LPTRRTRVPPADAISTSARPKHSKGIREPK
jgi:hypothetical protein